jgi:hypothetical protein
LPDAERDACDVLQALAGLVALLRRAADDLPGPDRREPALDDPRGVMLDLAEDGGVAAARVVAYLRELRGAGDGEACAVSPRLGERRDWVPGQRGSPAPPLRPRRIGALRGAHRAAPLGGHHAEPHVAARHRAELNHNALHHARAASRRADHAARHLCEAGSGRAASRTVGWLHPRRIA